MPSLLLKIREESQDGKREHEIKGGVLLMAGPCMIAQAIRPQS